MHSSTRIIIFMLALLLATILSDQAIIDYAKRLDVAKLDGSMHSQPLEQWLSDHFDEVSWRAECALKDPPDPFPVCVQVYVRRGELSGDLMLDVGDEQNGLAEKPILRYAAMHRDSILNGFRMTTKLSGVSELCAQLEQEAKHSTQPRVDDLPDWAKPQDNDVDLDGDGTIEHVEIIDLGGLDVHRYQLRAGPAAIEGEFFAAENDKPQVRFVRIDGWLEGNGRQEVEVMTSGPSDCRYEFFDYREGRFTRLVTLNSDNCSYAPVLLGACRIRMSSWHGFWEQRDRYELTPEPLLVKIPQRYYDVDVQGRWKENGDPIDVLLYDSAEKTYLVRETTGMVKVVREEDVTTLLDVEWAD